MCSGALTHLTKAWSLSFVFFCVHSLILVGSALTFKVNAEQVLKLITLSHDVRLGCLVMGLPFGFLFKMEEIQSHFTLSNERDARQDSETCRYFSLLEERFVDYVSELRMWELAAPTIWYIPPAHGFFLAPLP